MAGERTSQVDPILLAAAELFERQGYDDTSMLEIAARAGFARSTVFARYAGKQALLVGIVRAFHEALRRVPSGPSGRSRTGRAKTGRQAPAARDGAIPPGAADLDRFVQRVHDACQRLGSLARVACAAGDLPWIRSRVGVDGPAVTELLRDWFGDVGQDELVYDLLWDVLRRSCVASSRRDTFDVEHATRLIALLRLWEPALRDRPASSRGPQTRPARLPA
jgi:AcrR family transcriptional regulator